MLCDPRLAGKGHTEIIFSHSHNALRRKKKQVCSLETYLALVIATFSRKFWTVINLFDRVCAKKIENGFILTVDCAVFKKSEKTIYFPSPPPYSARSSKTKFWLCIWFNKKFLMKTRIFISTKRLNMSMHKSANSIIFRFDLHNCALFASKRKSNSCVMHAGLVNLSEKVQQFAIFFIKRLSGQCHVSRSFMRLTQLFHVKKFLQKLSVVILYLLACLSMYVCLCIFVCVCLSAHVCLCMFVCVCLSAYISVCLSVYVSVHKIFCNCEQGSEQSGILWVRYMHKMIQA